MRVVFYKDAQETLAVPPRLSEPEQDLVEIIDLPPQQTVTLHLQVAFPSENVGDIEKAKSADKVKFLADIPGENPFEENLPVW